MIDWFRLAQDRKRWRKIVDAAYPHKKLTAEQKKELDRWVPGLPLPGVVAQEEEMEQDAGAPEEPAADEGEDSEQELVATGGKYVCPVCDESFGTGNITTQSMEFGTLT